MITKMESDYSHRENHHTEDKLASLGVNLEWQEVYFTITMVAIETASVDNANGNMLTLKK